MSAADTVKEIMRVGNTAGIPRDFMDFLEEKCALLEQQIVALEEQLASLEKENTQFKVENRRFRTGVKNPKQGDLQEFMGALWRRTDHGVEPIPYCKECAHHPPMSPQPPYQPVSPMFWKCERGHVAPFSGRPK